MIIDAHTHLGRPGGVLDRRVGDLLQSMDAAKIDKALVFAGRLNSLTTKDLLDEIAPHRDRLYGVGSISMRPRGRAFGRRHWAEVDTLLKSGLIRGLKFYPGYEYFYPADEWLRPFLKKLVKYDRPAIFHSGDTYSKAGGAKLKYAMAIHIDDLAAEMPDLKIVIAHLGWPFVREAAAVVYKNQNVYADCSGLFYGEASLTGLMPVWTEFVSIAGADKVLFGSDWPICDQKSYVESVKLLYSRYEGLNFEGNAVKLFGL